MKLVARLRNCLSLVSTRLYLFSLRRKPGVVLGRVELHGIPIVDVRNGGRLVIEDHARLKSRNQGYHLNMFARVKLFVDRPNAMISIGAYTRIYGSCIHAFSRVEIGRNCLIAANCQIMDANGHDPCFDSLEKRAASKDRGRPVVIEDYVWLGTGCIVLPGVRIGRGSVVGAGSVVTHDIPSMCVAVGNPAKVVRQFDKQGIGIPLCEARHEKHLPANRL